MKRRVILTAIGLSVMLIFTLAGCDTGGGGGGGGSCPEPTLDISVCDPSTADFSDSLTIDNVFFPLEVGTKLTLQGEDDGETIRVEITVLDETEDVDGVTTRVVEEREWEDGELVEVSRNFFAQESGGTVCYFGEEVMDYESGSPVPAADAWRADEGDNRPGIMMPANPQEGNTFYQEYAPDVAEDMGTVVALGEPITVLGNTYNDTVTMEDCNPLEGAEKDEKVYVKDIGLVVDDVAELIAME